MDAEKSLISKAISEKSLAPVLAANITSAFFVDDEWREVFEWMLKFYRDYNEAPGKEALGKEFPTFKLVRVREPYDFYIDHMIEARKKAVLYEGFEYIGPSLEAGDDDAAIKHLSLVLDQLFQETSRSLDEDITQTTTNRYAAYQEAKKNRRGLAGIESGFPLLDGVTGGWLKEQLITVVGLPKSGKSILLILMAIAAHRAGYSTLFVTFEMSNYEQNTRHDAFRSHISHPRLKNHRLLPKEMLRWKRMMNSLGEMPEFTIIHDRSAVTTVSGLASKVAQFKPDILFVDGVYLMDVEIDALPGSPQALTHITRSMKKLCQRANIPIVQTTQVLPSKYQPSRGIQMDSIGYSSSFAQDSDIIIGFERPETETRHEADMKIVAGRDVERRKFRVYIDWMKGRYTETLITDDDEDAEEEDVSRFGLGDDQ